MLCLLQRSALASWEESAAALIGTLGEKVEAFETRKGSGMILAGYDKPSHDDLRRSLRAFAEMLRPLLLRVHAEFRKQAVRTQYTVALGKKEHELSWSFLNLLKRSGVYAARAIVLAAINGVRDAREVLLSAASLISDPHGRWLPTLPDLDARPPGTRVGIMVPAQGESSLYEPEEARADWPRGK